MKWISCVALVIALAHNFAAAVERLAFDASTTSNVTYRLLWGTNLPLVSGSMDIGTNLTTVLSNGPWGRAFFGAVAVSTNNTESQVSNIITVTNKPYAPLQMRSMHEFGSITLEASDDLINWEPVATIRQGDPPVNVVPQPRQFFRVSLPLIPKMPGLTAASVAPRTPVLKLHKQRGMQ